jgi:uncharacterized membrane protein YsdA (DUF1294 family)/cold shock CspA family protein
MRYQGKISDWKDDQGFGFVTPNGGGERAFVHIKSISDRSRRPINGDIITYEAVRDEKNRLKAGQVRFVNSQSSPSTSTTGNAPRILFSVTFTLALFLLAFLNTLHMYIPLAYTIMSLIAFLAYAFDKSAAMNNRWRIQESTLHLFGLLGGWPGALVAQKMFRHKSKKSEFQITFWFTVLLNLCVLGWFITSTNPDLTSRLIN